MLFSFSAGLLVAIVVDLLLGGEHLVGTTIPATLTFFILLRTGWGVRAEKWLDSAFENKRNRVPLTLLAISIIAGVFVLAYFTR